MAHHRTASRLEILARHVRKEGFLQRMLGCVLADLSGEGMGAALFLDLRLAHPERTTLREGVE